MVIEKAIAIANEFRCDIFLLYNHSRFISFPYTTHASGIMDAGHPSTEDKKMKELVEHYKSQLKEGLTLHGEIMSGSWFDMMKKFIIAHHIDLVVLPGNSRQLWGALIRKLNINRLARITSCPVLVVSQHFDIAHLRNIVVPVDGCLPVRKLTAATYIAKRSDSIIHLMGFKKSFHEKDPVDTKWLTKAYQLLRDHTQLKIHRSSSYGHSVASNTLSYAKLVEADLIVVNPGKESVLGGTWTRRILGKYIYKESTIAVLTIAQQQ